MKKLFYIAVLVFGIMGFSTVCHAEDGLQVYYSFDTDSVTEKDDVYTIKDLSGNGYDGTSTELSIATLSEFNVIDSICGTGKAVCGAVKIPNEAFADIDSSYTINFVGKYIWKLRPIILLDFSDCFYTSAWGSGMIRHASYFENSEKVGFMGTSASCNEYNMYTFICDKGQIRMYINGIEVNGKYDDDIASVILSEIAQNTENEFIVQNYYLDEFRLYNRALSEDEIQTLYKSVDLTPEPTIEPTIVPTTEPTGLQIYYSFDADSVTKKDGASYTIKDLSSNGFDAISYTEPKIVADFIPVLETVQAVKNECIDLANTSSSVYLPKEAFVGVEDFTMNFWHNHSAMQVFCAQSASTEKKMTIKSMVGSGLVRVMSYWENNAEIFSIAPSISSKDLYSAMHMYTIVRSEGNIKMYFDGEEMEAKYSTDGISNMTFAEIASNDDATIGLVNGYIDEFRFYDESLTNEEIKLIYDSEKPIPTPTIIPTVAPTDEPKTDISLSIGSITDDGVLNCTIHNNISEDIVSKCIVAVYNSKGELKGIKVTDGAEKGDTPLEFENCSDINKIKVFVWDSVTGMKPQFNSIEYQI